MKVTSKARLNTLLDLNDVFQRDSLELRDLNGMNTKVCSHTMAYPFRHEIIHTNIVSDVAE